MNVRSLLLGLLLGFAAGWLVSRLTGTRVPEATTEEATDDGQPVGNAAEAPVVLRGPSGSSNAKHPYETPDVETLRRRLETAQEGGDGPAFVDSLRGLGLLGTPDAHRALVAVLKDPQVLFPEDLAHEFRTWLADSEIEGIAEAAKARFEIRRRAEYDVERAGSGWFFLIGAHGSRAWLDWAREESRLDRRLEGLCDELAVGFLRSSRPGALAHARHLARAGHGLPGGPWRLVAFRAWVRLDPSSGIPALVEEIDRGLGSAPPRGTIDTELVLQLYAESLPASSFPEAADVIRRVAGPREPLPLTAFQSIRRLHRRGMSLDGLESLVERPAVFLERVAARGGPVDEDENAQKSEARRS